MGTILHPKFPTKLEADIYGDMPNIPPPDDEDIYGIPFPSAYPTRSRAASSPNGARGGDGLFLSRRPQLIRGSIIFALECLAVTAALFIAARVIGGLSLWS